jgi:hypothetical protein
MSIVPVQLSVVVGVAAFGAALVGIPAAAG